MFHQPASQQPPFFSPARVLTRADYGWDEERDHSFAPFRADGLVPGRIVRAERGLRGVGLHEADEGLDQAFAEITELAGDCRFADCAHTTEPGCAVLAAVESGHLTRRRLDSYRRLLRENAYAASRTDARLRAAQERPKKDIARMRRAINRSGNPQT
ncbi:ribosome small subunit-dependent GTPase A [Streptomyces jeddahensis]|uniref:Putative ribosome biogenesis GTPase RsgA n=1 Tax=Streptomyces jeddahensis TaxID=1716141 RepID=A0A177HH36_9ACTN|nr:putative ribosome biogenesis GTPase RsgA [Streptomyces jeddahensis]